jgi:predicted RNA binding protein YcfA (HicA-like mRNA interferase family)
VRQKAEARLSTPQRSKGRWGVSPDGEDIEWRDRLKYRDLIKLIEQNGWYFHRYGRGDHMIYRHPTRSGSVVVAGGGKLSRDVPRGTLDAILRQAGLK